MVQLTPPASKGVSGIAARKHGEACVRSDIRKVYGIPSTMYAEIQRRDPKLAGRFWALIKTRDFQEATALARRITGHEMRSFDGGDAHRRRRNRHGVVDSIHPSMYVHPDSAEELRTYSKKREGNVGIYASGFNTAATTLGAKGVPAWVTRHGTAYSGINVRQTDTSFFIVLTDRVPFGQADTVRRMDYVLRYRDRALTDSMPHIIRRMVRVAGFAATTT
jgi:hypothetical protein